MQDWECPLPVENEGRLAQTNHTPASKSFPDFVDQGIWFWTGLEDDAAKELCSMETRNAGEKIRRGRSVHTKLELSCPSP